MAVAAAAVSGVDVAAATGPSSSSSAPPPPDAGAVSLTESDGVLVVQYRLPVKLRKVPVAPPLGRQPQHGGGGGSVAGAPVVSGAGGAEPLQSPPLRTPLLASAGSTTGLLTASHSEAAFSLTAAARPTASAGSSSSSSSGGGAQYYRWEVSWDEEALLSPKGGADSHHHRHNARGVAASRAAAANIAASGGLGGVRIKWIGTPPVHVDAADEDAVARALEPFSCIPVFLPRHVESAYYDGYCRDTLWPIFHNVIDVYGELPTRWWVRERQADRWKSYCDGNQRFAAAVVENFHEGDLVWVHDYHLLLVPTILARRHIAPIALFLHIPFPSSEVFRTLSVRDELLRGMLSADALGFHLFEYARHFLTSCRRILGLTHSAKRGGILAVDYQGREVQVSISHVGVEPAFLRAQFRHCGAGGPPVAAFEPATRPPVVHDGPAAAAAAAGGDAAPAAAAAAPSATGALCISSSLPCSAGSIVAAAAAWRAAFPGALLIGGLDSIERLRGVPLKLAAYEAFLGSTPGWAGRVTLVQVCTQEVVRPGDTQEGTLGEIASLAERINAAHGLPGAPPAVHLVLTASLPLRDRLALWAACDVYLNTSIRDGLNLTPFEYAYARGSGVCIPDGLAAQAAAAASAAPRDDGGALDALAARPPGALILSEFSGASRVLAGALRVNPFRQEEVVSALAHALHMTAGEQGARCASNLQYVLGNTTTAWAGRILCDLKRVSARAVSRTYMGYGLGLGYRLMGFGSSFRPLNTEHALTAYRKSSHRLIVVDYGGTLHTRESSLIKRHAFEMGLLGKDAAPPLTSETKRALRALSEDWRNTVFVVSGKERDVLAAAFAGLPHVGLSAEHGAYYRWPAPLAASSGRVGSQGSLASTATGGGSGTPKLGGMPGGDAALPPSAANGDNGMPWESLVDASHAPPSSSGAAEGAAEGAGSAGDASGASQPPHSSLAEEWKALGSGIMETYAARTNGVYMLRKGSAISWHYGDADPEFGSMQAKELQDHLAGVLAGYPVDVLGGHDYVEVRPKGVSKGMVLALIMDYLEGRGGGAAAGTGGGGGAGAGGRAVVASGGHVPEAAGRDGGAGAARARGGDATPSPSGVVVDRGETAASAAAGRRQPEGGASAPQHHRPPHHRRIRPPATSSAAMAAASSASAMAASSFNLGDAARPAHLPPHAPAASHSHHHQHAASLQPAAAHPHSPTGAAAGGIGCSVSSPGFVPRPLEFVLAIGDDAADEEMFATVQAYRKERIAERRSLVAAVAAAAAAAAPVRGGGSGGGSDGSASATAADLARASDASPAAVTPTPHTGGIGGGSTPTSSGATEGGPSSAAANAGFYYDGGVGASPLPPHAGDPSLGVGTQMGGAAVGALGELGGGDGAHHLHSESLATSARVSKFGVGHLLNTGGEHAEDDARHQQHRLHHHHHRHHASHPQQPPPPAAAPAGAAVVPGGSAEGGDAAGRAAAATPGPRAPAASAAAPAAASSAAAVLALPPFVYFEYTVTVGKKPSAAQYYLDDTQQTEDTLRSLARAALRPRTGGAWGSAGAGPGAVAAGGGRMLVGGDLAAPVGAAAAFPAPAYMSQSQLAPPAALARQSSVGAAAGRGGALGAGGLRVDVGGPAPSLYGGGVAAAPAAAAGVAGASRPGTSMAVKAVPGYARTAPQARAGVPSALANLYASTTGLSSLLALSSLVPQQQQQVLRQPARPLRGSGAGGGAGTAEGTAAAAATPPAGSPAALATQGGGPAGAASSFGSVDDSAAAGSAGGSLSGGAGGSGCDVASAAAVSPRRRRLLGASPRGSSGHQLHQQQAAAADLGSHGEGLLDWEHEDMPLAATGGGGAGEDDDDEAGEDGFHMTMMDDEGGHHHSAGVLDGGGYDDHEQFHASTSPQPSPPRAASNGPSATAAGHGPAGGGAPAAAPSHHQAGGAARHARGAPALPAAGSTLFHGYAGSSMAFANTNVPLSSGASHLALARLLAAPSQQAQPRAPAGGGGGGASGWQPPTHGAMMPAGSFSFSMSMPSLAGLVPPAPPAAPLPHTAAPLAGAAGSAAAAAPLRLSAAGAPPHAPLAAPAFAAFLPAQPPLPVPASGPSVRPTLAGPATVTVLPLRSAPGGAAGGAAGLSLLRAGGGSSVAAPASASSGSGGGGGLQDYLRSIAEDEGDDVMF